jgi:hypothetical protein
MMRIATADALISALAGGPAGADAVADFQKGDE